MARYNIYYHRFNILARDYIPYVTVVDTEDVYHAIGKMICTTLEELKNIRYTKPKAGTTALVYYDYDIPSRELCIDMYHKTGAFVTPGDCFEQGRSMRIGYACDQQVLKDGLAAIDEYFALLDGEGK